MMKRILICGGRDYDNWPEFCAAMDSFIADRGWHTIPDQYGNWLPEVTVISGGAQGADSMADQWAMINWCPFEEYKADWKTHGRAAGPIRNEQMLYEGTPDVVIAFPGGKGTAHMMKIARKAGVEVVELP